MGLSMKRFLVIITIYVLFSVKTASAFIPLVIPAWYLAAGAAMALTAAGAGMYYAMKSGHSATVSPLGNLSRVASVAYIASKAGANVLDEHDVTAQMTYAQLSSLANAVSTLYPLVKDAINGIGLAPTLDKNSTVGTVYSTPVGNKRLTESCGVRLQDGSYTGDSIQMVGSDKVYVVYQNPTNGYYQASNCFYLGPDNRTPSPLTPTEAAKRLAANNVSGDVRTPYQAEIDKMFQDPNYVPTFTDDTTGLPYATPPGVLTPGQVTAINTAGAAADARESTITKIGEAAAAAAAATNTANNNVQSAQAAQAAAATAAAASPNDAALAAALAAANVALANAQAALADAQAKQAAAEAEQAKSQETLPTEDTTGKLHKWKWDKFETLKNLIPTVFPFSLISTLGSYLSVLVADPVAPSFDLPLYQSNVMHISLDIFDPVATVCRWLIGILLTIGGVQLVIGFWRGN